MNQTESAGDQSPLLYQSVTNKKVVAAKNNASGALQMSGSTAYNGTNARSDEVSLEQ